MTDIKAVDNKKRAIYLMGDIDEPKSEAFIKSILELELQDPGKDIVVIIDSYGGYVDSMWAMQDAMNMVACKVHTLCIGKAMSCGQMMLVGGAKGRRYATPNSRIMMHEISSASFGKISDMKNHTKEMTRLDKQFKKFIVDNTKLTAKQLEEKLKCNCYMSAQEALKLGFIDKIITKFSNIELKGW
jgi:ATP-dependent Clp protease protease subunit